MFFVADSFSSGVDKPIRGFPTVGIDPPPWVNDLAPDKRLIECVPRPKASFREDFPGPSSVSYTEALPTVKKHRTHCAYLDYFGHAEQDIELRKTDSGPQPAARRGELARAPCDGDFGPPLPCDTAGRETRSRHHRRAHCPG